VKADLTRMLSLPLLSNLDLRSAPGADVLAAVRERASPELAAVARRLARAFRVESPFAPGFCCIGGEIELDDHGAAASGMDRLSVTGNGETLETALTSCLGEAADLLSQFERKGDVTASGSPADHPDGVSGGWIGQALSDARGPIDWMVGRRVGAGTTALLPADLCLRRKPAVRVVEPAGALSAGVAAGPDFESAALRAVLELCERDAAALWWLGGRRPKGFPLEHAAARYGTALVERLRRGATERRTLLLDITTDLGVPTIAAISIGADGRGLACGLAARLDAREAAKAAILELCQMELATPIAEAKRVERGEAALNEADRRHLHRAAFAAADCELLHPCGVSSLETATPLDGLDALANRLHACGIDILLVGLTRPELRIAVVRAVSPDLQPFAATVSTERLGVERASATRHAAVAAVPLL